MTVAARILVVDDEPNGFEVIEALLFREGYELSYAADGFEALQRLEMTLPDVILLDVMMPELDGMEVCRRIKAHETWRHIPVVMVTALNAKEDLARCLDAGADDFISKPITGIELRARVRSMLRIKQQYDALVATLQLREDLSDSIVHDLRNPITSITLAVDILSNTPLDSKQTRKVEQIERSAKQLRSLTDQFLIIAKADTGKMTLERCLVQLTDLAAEAIADFEAIAQHKQIKIHLNAASTVELSVDTDLLRRVFENLLANAIKFSPARSEIVVAIESEKSSDGMTEIAISDQGKGVSPALQQAIFERYEIGQIMPGVQQTGLGLAFCKLAVEAHGGRIWASNNSPQGAVFTIQLPNQTRFGLGSRQVQLKTL
jgi:two-component system sensor histidine kinase/response regulator